MVTYGMWGARERRGEGRQRVPLLGPLLGCVLVTAAGCVGGARGRKYTELCVGTETSGRDAETSGRDARHRGEMSSEQVSFLLSLPTPVPSTSSLRISGPQIPFGPHPPPFRMLSVNHRVCSHGHPCPPWSQPSLISLSHKVHWLPPQAHAFSSPLLMFFPILFQPLLTNTLTNCPSLFTSGFCFCYSFSTWNTAPDPLVIFSFYVFCFSDLLRTSKSGIYLGNPNHVLHWLDPSTVLCAWLCFRAVKAWTCEGQVCGMKMRQVRLESLIGDLQMWV